MTHELKDLLSSALHRNGINGVVTASEVIRETDSVISRLFGEGFNRRARAAQYRGEVVVIEVNSSVIANELKFQEQRLLAELSARGVVVRRLEIHQKDFS